MKFWVDAQLPPMLAEWMSKEYGVDAISLRDLGLRDASDIEIFQAAHRAQVIVISKDNDFVELVSRHGAPPQLLWVTCGNVTNERLQAIFGKTFPDALASSPGRMGPIWIPTGLTRKSELTDNG